jgi:hypothetical protein
MDAKQVEQIVRGAGTPRSVITTFTGRNVNPLDLCPEDVDVRDIAHALALCNRFAGHTAEPLSVAQHCVYAVALVPPQHKLQALLHDAAEAYLGDVTKWLKAQPEMSPYRAAERAAQRAVYERFNVDYEPSQELDLADRTLVRYEGMKGFGKEWSVAGLNPLAWRDYPHLTPQEMGALDSLFGGWQFWNWRKAEEWFLGTFDSLYGGR